jgi:hypothetical protein
MITPEEPESMAPRDCLESIAIAEAALRNQE